MVEPNLIEALVREHIPNVEHFSLEDLTGGKDHYQAVVVSSAFEGKTRVQQHQMVYKALGDLMAGPVHALALSTFTPDAWSKRGKSLL
jgi:stress-induced morphogen